MNTAAWNWKLLNVILLGLGFMMIFTAFQTTSMCSKLVTSSLKEEMKTSSADFRTTYESRLLDDKFMMSYTGDKRQKIIDEYKAGSDTNLSNDSEIVTEKIKDDIMNTLYGDGYLSMSLLYGIFSLANFASAAIVKICGHKVTMVSKYYSFTITSVLCFYIT